MTECLFPEITVHREEAITALSKKSDRYTVSIGRDCPILFPFWFVAVRASVGDKRVVYWFGDIFVNAISGKGLVVTTLPSFYRKSFTENLELPPTVTAVKAEEIARQLAKTWIYGKWPNVIVRAITILKTELFLHPFWLFTVEERETYVSHKVIVSALNGAYHLL